MKIPRTTEVKNSVSTLYYILFLAFSKLKLHSKNKIHQDKDVVIIKMKNVQGMTNAWFHIN